MSEISPLHAFAEELQDRRQPSFFTPTDGQYALVLGMEGAISFDFETGDYTEIRQDVDLTGINLVRIDAKVVQPSYQVDRYLTGPEILRGEILEYLDRRLSIIAGVNVYAKAFHAYTESQLFAPFRVKAGSVLNVAVDGGVDRHITFPGTVPEILCLTATQAVGIINAQITGALAQYYTSTGGIRLVLSSDSTGQSSRIEVKTFGLNDANDYLRFSQRGGPYRGGDDLSAISASEDFFTSADTLMPLVICDALPANNGSTRITKVVNPQLALLANNMTADDSATMAAVVHAPRWRACIYIDDSLCTVYVLDASKTITSFDMSANVSKLVGTHTVTLRLELLQGPTGAVPTTATTYGTATFGTNTYGG